MVDFFSFDGEATDKPKPASEIRRFQRPGDVPGDEPKQHHVAGTFNLGGLLAPDQMTPFEKLNRRMVRGELARAPWVRGMVSDAYLVVQVPGDVPFDDAPLHHKEGRSHSPLSSHSCQNSRHSKLSWCRPAAAARRSCRNPHDSGRFVSGPCRLSS